MYDNLYTDSVTDARTLRLPQFAPVAGPVREPLVASLRAAIQEGELRPGDRLIEREVCEATGASRTAVREALRLLQGEGLVTLLPQRGCVVTTFTPQEAGWIYGMRALLEGEAARMFAHSASAEEAAALEGAYRALDLAYEHEDFGRIMDASSEFDRALFAGCGNPLLGETSQQLGARTAYLRRLTVRFPGRTAQARAEYRAVRAAIADRDPERAQQAMRSHVEQSMAIAMVILEQATIDETG